MSRISYGPALDVSDSPAYGPTDRPFVPAAGGGASSPLLIDGATAALWIFDTSNTFQQSDGTGATADTTPVGYATDLSGNSNHITMATTADKPTMNVSGGLEYITGDVSDTLALGGTISAISTAADFSVYQGYYRPSNSFCPAWVQADGTGVDNNDRISMLHQTSGIACLTKEGDTNQAYTTTHGSLSTATWYVTAFKYDLDGSPKLTHRVNGVGAGTANPVSTIATATDFQILRGRLTSGLSVTGAGLTCIAVYNRLLTTEEEDTVEAEIARLSGVTLP